LSGYLKERLAEMPRVRLVSSTLETVSACGTTLFEVEGTGGIEMRARFKEEGFEVDDHLRDGHDAVRVSTHFYNSRDELDQFLSRLFYLLQ
jgi:selenocysteine lyase/cysteine desulfurase